VTGKDRGKSWCEWEVCHVAQYPPQRLSHERTCRALLQTLQAANCNLPIFVSKFLSGCRCDNHSQLLSLPPWYLSDAQILSMYKRIIVNNKTSNQPKIWTFVRGILREIASFQTQIYQETITRRKCPGHVSNVAFCNVWHGLLIESIRIQGKSLQRRQSWGKIIKSFWRR